MVVVAGGRIVQSRSFGGDRQIGSTTPFVIGSTSKPITALAAMQLVDRGRLRLSDRVHRWIPELELAGADARLITVGQLLDQTSGISPVAGGRLIRSVGQGSMLAAVDELDGAKLVSKPGSEFHYANANYLLAGLVVERASGERYGRYVEQMIFRPLGAKCSFTSIERARARGLSSGNRYWFGLPVRHGPTFARAMQPAGYLIACAEDMAQLLAAILNGGMTTTGERLASERSIARLLAPGPAATLGRWADSAASRYGLGWFVGGPWRESAILHPGNTPDSSSMLVMLPQRNWGVVTMLAAGNALELPGSPDAIDLTARNAVDALLGEAVKQGSLTRFYAVFDLLAILALAIAVWTLVRGVRASGRSQAGGRGRRLLIAVALLIVGLLLLAYPGLGLGYAATWLWTPDLALVLLLVGTLLVASAVVRLAKLHGSSRASHNSAGA